jgi:hypothetical protein
MLTFSEYLKIKHGKKTVNESRIIAKPYVYQEFEQCFSQYNWSKPVSAKILELENAWVSIQSDFNWNREIDMVHRDHFSIDAKVPFWPDVEKLRTEVELSDEDLTEDEIERLVSLFLAEEREFFTYEVADNNEWIAKVAWGGRSGGWLLICPKHNYEYWMDGIREYIDSGCHDDLILQEADDYEMMVARVNSPEHERLSRMGLANDPEIMKDLLKTIDEIKQLVDENLAELSQWRSDMVGFIERIMEFRNDASNIFHEWAVDRIVNGEY